MQLNGMPIPGSDQAQLINPAKKKNKKKKKKKKSKNKEDKTAEGAVDQESHDQQDKDDEEVLEPNSPEKQISSEQDAK